MPVEPLWMERLPEMRVKITTPDAPPWWDRPAIENLFGLRHWQTIALLHQSGACCIGTGFAVDPGHLQGQQ